MPEPLVCELGVLQLKFLGSINDEEALRRINESVQIIAEKHNINYGKKNTYSFNIGEQVVELSNFGFEVIAFEDGSIIAKVKMMAAYALTTYTIAAAYPSFKEAIPVITADLTYVIELVFSERKDAPPAQQTLLGLQIIFKEEDEVEEQIISNGMIG